MWLVQQIGQRAGDDLGGAAQVFQLHTFVVAFGVGLEHGARACAVDHAGDTRLALQAHFGVERGAHGLDGFAEQFAAVFLDRVHQGFVASEGLH